MVEYNYLRYLQIENKYYILYIIKYFVVKDLQIYYLNLNYIFFYKIGTQSVYVKNKK